MPNIMRSALLVFFSALFLHTTAVAAARNSTDLEFPNGNCVSMTVSASDIASFGDRGRQQYRILFENRCDSVRIVYWCAENPSTTLKTNSVCVSNATTRAGVAAPLYAVVRQREFQWTFPPGTRIRYVECSDSAYPTSDFRCTTDLPRR